MDKIAKSITSDIKQKETDEFNQLTKQIDTTLTNLRRKRDTLMTQIKQFEDIERSLTTSTASLSSSNDALAKIQFRLDSGDVIEKSREEALEFINKRVLEIKESITQFNTKINEGEMTKEKLRQFNEIIRQEAMEATEDKDHLSLDKLNEEGLPFMDIQEEIDEDGNVVSAKINDAKVEKAKEKEKPKIEVIEEKKPKDEKEKEDLKTLFEEMEVISQKDGKNRDLNFDQDELLDKIDQLNISPEDKFNLKRVCVEEFKKLHEEEDDEKGKKDEKGEEDDIDIGNDSFQNFSVDRNDMIELELLADDFDDSIAENNGEYNDDEEMDYDFEDDEDDHDDDDDDDDAADELLYGGGRAKIIGGDVKSNNMLWDQIMNLRKGKLGVNDNDEIVLEEEVQEGSSKKGKKAVRFSEELDIKEVDNISDSLKNPPPAPSKMSLFKQNRVFKNSKTGFRHDEDDVVGDIVDKDDDDDVMHDVIERDDVMHDVIERDDVMSDKIVEREIVERDDFMEPPKKKSTSRFKSMRNEQSSSKPAAIILIPNENTNIPEHDETSEWSRSTSQGVPLDMDKMVQDYVAGKYDDDITTDGPVVQELKDFEPLNDIVESRKNDLVGTQDFDVDSNEVGDDKEQGDDSDDDDGEILSEIVENDFDDDDGEDQAAFNEDAVMDREIRENYHKLRNKLILDDNGFKKSQEELEFEPTDEDGNPVKMSRFKAAKLNRNV
ncbi:Bud site selection protein 27 [Candida viswanathii]|uniref:Bud site selection protein 27 n=1 Tax=Candida viswanathii TaxID=5486 RepID=A0A367YJC2_9ASCO|nr:Bud site selection protein 27 [Candida viswanathii]